MYKIYIDTTNKYNRSLKLIELVNNSEKEIENVHGDFDVAPSIDQLMKKYNINPKDVQEIVPNTGPGSFTGIKVGLAIANVFNWAIGKNKTYEPNYGGEPNIMPRKDRV